MGHFSQRKLSIKMMGSFGSLRHRCILAKLLDPNDWPIHPFEIGSPMSTTHYSQLRSASRRLPFWLKWVVDIGLTKTCLSMHLLQYRFKTDTKQTMIQSHTFWTMTFPFGERVELARLVERNHLTCQFQQLAVGPYRVRTFCCVLLYPRCVPEDLSSTTKVQSVWEVSAGSQQGLKRAKVI